MKQTKDPVISAIRQAIKQYGKEILLDGQRFYAFMLDSIPTQKKELKAIKQVCEENALKPLASVAGEYVEFEGKKIVLHLVKDCYLNEECSESVVNWVIEALGFGEDVVDFHDGTKQESTNFSYPTNSIASNIKVTAPTKVAPTSIHTIDSLANKTTGSSVARRRARTRRKLADETKDKLSASMYVIVDLLAILMVGLSYNHIIFPGVISDIIGAVVVVGFITLIIFNRDYTLILPFASGVNALCTLAYIILLHLVPESAFWVNGAMGAMYGMHLVWTIDYIAYEIHGANEGVVVRIVGSMGLLALSILHLIYIQDYDERFAFAFKASEAVVFQFTLPAFIAIGIMFIANNVKHSNNCDDAMAYVLSNITAVVSFGMFAGSIAIMQKFSLYYEFYVFKNYEYLNCILGAISGLLVVLTSVSLYGDEPTTGGAVQIFPHLTTALILAGTIHISVARADAMNLRYLLGCMALALVPYYLVRVIVKARDLERHSLEIFLMLSNIAVAVLGFLPESWYFFSFSDLISNI